MARAINAEQLAGMDAKQLRTLRDNARASTDPKAAPLLQILEEEFARRNEGKTRAAPSVKHGLVWSKAADDVHLLRRGTTELARIRKTGNHSMTNRHVYAAEIGEGTLGHYEYIKTAKEAVLKEVLGEAA